MYDTAICDTTIYDTMIYDIAIYDTKIYHTKIDDTVILRFYDLLRCITSTSPTAGMPARAAANSIAVASWLIFSDQWPSKPTTK